MHINYVHEVCEQLEDRYNAQCEAIYKGRLFHIDGKPAYECLHRLGKIAKVYKTMLEIKQIQQEMAIAEGYKTLKEARDIKEGLAEDYSDMEHIKAEGKRVYSWENGGYDSKMEHNKPMTGGESRMNGNKPMSVRGGE